MPEQPAADPFGDPLQLAAGLSYMVLKEKDPALLRDRLVASTHRLFRADVARLFEPGEDGLLRPVVAYGEMELPESARALEVELAPRAVSAEKSLISDHPRLYAELRPFAARALSQGVLTHAMLIRAHAQSHGVVVVHWIGRDRPAYEDRRGAYLFWDNVGLAMATSSERQRLELELSQLERLALYDELTELPNQRLLVREVEGRLDAAVPFVLLHVDFDGMREANNSPLGYEAGGDFLIRTVGRAIPTFLYQDEIAARLHRAGDEFACALRPGSDGLDRARALEHALDQLELPETHRPFYGGASVGYATSEPKDTPESLLARAAESMRGRKKERQQLKPR